MGDLRVAPRHRAVRHAPERGVLAAQLDWIGAERDLLTAGPASRKDEEEPRRGRLAILCARRAPIAGVCRRLGAPGGHGEGRRGTLPAVLRLIKPRQRRGWTEGARPDTIRRRGGIAVPGGK